MLRWISDLDGRVSRPLRIYSPSFAPSQIPLLPTPSLRVASHVHILSSAASVCPEISTNYPPTIALTTIHTSCRYTTCAMSNSSRSSTSSVAPNTLVALPSLSCALSSLPQARSLDGIAIHPTSMSAQRHAESEAKVHKNHLILHVNFWASC